jgi:hypothetical protein
MSKLKANAVEVFEYYANEKFGSIHAVRYNGEVLVRLDGTNRLKWFKKEQIKRKFSRI